jgi:transglutaminase-like putative cysteine protease
MVGRKARSSALLLGVLAWALGTVWPLERSASAEPEGAATALPASNSAYILAVQPAQTVQVEYSIRYQQPDVDIKTWELAAAKPPVLIGQRAVSASVSPPLGEVTERSPLKRRVLVGTVVGEGATRHALDVKVTFRATLYARKLLLRLSGDRSDGPPDLPAAVREQYLRETANLDYKSATFSKWLDDNGLRRGPKEEEIAFARRTFLKVWGDLDYQLIYPKTASEVVQKRRCACGGFADVYVSALRANGIPSRTLLGRWVSVKDEDMRHATSEFFVRKVGWIPVDPTCGVFGEDRGDFFTFHVDRDLQVPMQSGDEHTFHTLLPINWMVIHEGTGKLKPSDPKDEKWTFRQEKQDARRLPVDADTPDLVPRVGRHAERHNPYRPAAPASTSSRAASGTAPGPPLDPGEDTEGLAYFWDRADGDYARWSRTFRGGAVVNVRSKKPR